MVFSDHLSAPDNKYYLERSYLPSLLSSGLQILEPQSHTACAYPKYDAQGLIPQISEKRWEWMPVLCALGGTFLASIQVPYQFHWSH